jgi:hypothetical protein
MSPKTGKTYCWKNSSVRQPSPELNLIEILWRRIKYHWLPLDAYQSYVHLKTEVLSILENIGEKYVITFT